MKPLAVGIDIVDVDRFARALDRWPRLSERVFTARERSACERSFERLAARFAVKEATFKALGDGWPRVAYRDVEVRQDGRGAPRLSLRGRAAALAGNRSCAVSIAHAAGIAIAEVVMTRQDS